MGLFDGFALDDGETRMHELSVACLDRKEKAFGVFPHDAVGVLFVTRRRVVFLADDTPLFETALSDLVAASISPPSMRSLSLHLVLRYRNAAGGADSVRFRYLEVGDVASRANEVFEAWIRSVARLMREERLELECP